MVTKFNEKIITGNNWINGDYFIVEPEIFKYLNGKNVILEKKPLEKLAKAFNSMVLSIMVSGNVWITK